MYLMEADDDRALLVWRPVVYCPAATVHIILLYSVLLFSVLLPVT